MSTNPTTDSLAIMKPTALIVPHTHWDREWRYPIWKNRAHLVHFMQELLQLLETDESYACFVLDGQCVVIEDYLEVCPGDAERVKAQVRAGRLKIGPWYTLPDLYPLDGECLVRNLLKGKRISQQFGGYLGVGYNSFGWGQTAQFPQIYAGFGFDFIVAAKRVSVERAPHCEYLWEGPDGTRILASRLGKDARANGFFQMYIPIRHGMPYLSDEYVWRWGTSGAVMHRAEPARADDDYFRVDKCQSYHQAMVGAAVQDAWNGMNESLLPDFRLISTGSDFTSPQPVITRIVRDANALLPDISFRMGTLEEYAAQLHARLDREAIPVVTGELRDGPASGCSGNALATRIHIKQLNKRVENALLRRAEPLAALLALLGSAWPAGFFELAWKHLLQAHPHDSINGVTQDKTADDTLYRLNQALEIAEVIFEESVAGLINRIDFTTYQADDNLLLVINPRPVALRCVVQVAIDTPAEQQTWDLAIEDCAGAPLDCQIISRRERTCPVEDMEARPWPFYFDRHLAYVDTGVIPAGGYTLLKVVAKNSFSRNTEWWPEMRTSRGLDIAKTPTTLENEFLKVEVQPDGSLTLLDKVRQRVFPNLHTFEDTGDIGDYWAYFPPYENRTYVSSGQPTRIWLEDNGALAATIAVEITMQVPARAVMPEKAAIRGESKRVAEMRAVVITSRISLKRGARRLEISTRIENTAQDHRMRVLFPTGIATDHAQSAGHFTVDSRCNIPPRNAAGEFWPEMQTLPQQMFVDVSNASEGFAVVNNSFTEYQLLDDARHTLAITLFRAVRNRICSEWRSSGNFPLQDGGQCLRTLDYEYAVVPHAGNWQQADIYGEAMELNTPPAVFQISPHSTNHGTLPPSASLWAVAAPGLVLSCFKRAEDRDSCILRLFNPGALPCTSTIQLPHTVTHAWLTNLDEERLQPLTVSNGAVEVTAASNAILTLELLAGTN